MQGSIRVILGLLITFGAVGANDDASLLIAAVTAVAGLALMYSGVRAINRKSF